MESQKCKNGNVKMYEWTATYGKVTYNTIFLNSQKNIISVLQVVIWQISNLLENKTKCNR